MSGMFSCKSEENSIETTDDIVAAANSPATDSLNPGSGHFGVLTGEGVKAKASNNQSNVAEGHSYSKIEINEVNDFEAGIQISEDNKDTSIKIEIVSEDTENVSSSSIKFAMVDGTYLCRGTRVLTTCGEMAIEELQVNDVIITALAGERGGCVVRRLGHCRIDPRRVPRPENANPVRIQAGALAEGVPVRDLRVSPSYHLALSGVLLRAGDLVNNASIALENLSHVEYWRIELDQHAILLANGAEAESYFDVGSRAECDIDATMLHPELEGKGAGACLPFAAPTLDLREHLAYRAEALGWRREIDPQPWLEAGRQHIGPQRRRDRLRFALPERCTEVRLRSRAERPRHVSPVNGDNRLLGLGLGRLALCGADGLWLEVPLDHPALVEGFSYPERDAAGWIWRWTDGNARLPLAILAPGRVVTALEITLDQTTQFWVPPSQSEKRAEAAHTGS